ncbi:LuxR C-terminal-related transcriptional regulator [Rhodococcus maanshanensis]|uniref:ATP-binding protein n=1 Tax=Rhodococcus maanshanensis TaxID=183556 RepID=UPI0022B52C8A|nr:LuxR C-terminal-related transcriptional regulator [Rhodococcus maanshanensis]MCZ4556280.1 LuxR C-terminal-related transcriptional regulator [Rhodococcus maanshanensis]
MSVATLPMELTSFVGRKAELSEVRRALSASRLVTLSGIGGVGKTRLALSAAEAERRAYPDGVWLVELGELRDPTLVVELVAAGVGVQNRSARPLLEVLVEVLYPSTGLLVLDNCEQLIEAVTELAKTLLTSCPKLRILVTSREPLNIGGESVIRVSPLTTPPAHHPLSLRKSTHFDAVSLFAERASLVLPDFELTGDNVNTVAQICARLEGLPLAIELAVARLKVLSPEQILQRLTDRYTLLTRGRRNAPSRQQTLQMCIGWSYDLCTPAERQLWARLSVFAGSLDLEAAEAVCADDEADQDLVDTLASLVDKSILIREQSRGGVRFRLLDTVRDFGRDKLDHTGQQLALRRRHHDWYLQLALDADDAWMSPNQLEWTARLARDLPNVREALEFSLSGSGESVLRIAAAMNQFWVSRGLLSEGRRWLDRALARTSDKSSADRAKALYAVAVIAATQGDLAAATARIEEGRALDARQEDPLWHVFVAISDGYVALHRGDVDQDLSPLEEAVEDSRARGEFKRLVEALLLLGLSRQARGQIAEALACHEEMLAITRAHGETVYRSYALWSIALTARGQGDNDRAVHCLEESLRLIRLADDPVSAVICLQALASIAGERHDARRAAVLMGASDALGRTVGTVTLRFPDLIANPDEFTRDISRALGMHEFEAAYREGGALDFGGAIAFALGEQSPEEAPAVRHLASLTERELQVADLIADGLTNKDIAGRLAISPGTVNGHVEHILAKLGLSSRTKIAVLVVQHKRGEHI